MEIRQEDLNDLPLIAHFINESGLSAAFDRHYPVHGNWKGPSFGKMMMGWLLYIISECDHRLYTVQDWADRHRGLLQHLLGCAAFDDLCFHDDRLCLMLEQLSDMDRYGRFMEDYTRNLVLLYELPATIVRVDSFNVPSYREDDGEGLFRHGYKKSHQADEPHLKVMAACLDPLALPIAALSVPGSCSDDELYLPVIEQAKRSLQKKGLVYVGDTKMGSSAVCGRLAGDGDFYLCPLSTPNFPKGGLADYVRMASSAPAEQVLTIFKEGPKGDKVLTDRVVELPSVQRQRIGDGFCWTERRIMVYSLPYAQGQEKKLRDRIAKAQKEIEERFAPKKHGRRWRGGQEHLAQAFIEKVLEEQRVAPFLSATLASPAKNPAKNPLQVALEVDEAAISDKMSDIGWRPYITNVPLQVMDAKQVLVCYRNEYLIEHQFHKVLTKTTALLPINLKKDKRCAALINLMLLAIQFVSIIQHRAHEEIQKTQSPMTDVVPGNKSRKVWKPSAEMLLRRFKGVNVVWIRLPDGTVSCQLLNFKAAHQKILDLLGCPKDLYFIYAKNCFP